MPSLTINTRQARWVIPEHFEFVKMLIAQQQLHAAELCFSSEEECQYFAKKLSLMALEDECKYKQPSVIADLSRYLVARSAIEK